jgi:hypothetical protein
VLKLEDKDFNDYVTHLSESGSRFIVDEKRNTKSIIISGKYFAFTKNKNHLAKGEEKKEMLSLFSQVGKSVSNYIKLNEFDVEKIKQIHPQTQVDRKKYEKMKVGAEFFYVDISHCFWRIGFLKGYINPKLYNKVLKNPSLKQFRNMSLAIIKAARSRYYFDNGKLINKVTEERTLWENVYDNIRFTCYNFLGETKSVAGNKFVAYKTDGIMVTRPALKKIKDAFTAAGFEYKVITCFKVDDKNYSYGGLIKKI